MVVVCTTRVSFGFLGPLCGRYSDRINASSPSWKPSTSTNAPKRNVSAWGTVREASSRGRDIHDNSNQLVCISHQNIGRAMWKKLPYLLSLERNPPLGSSKRNPPDVIVWTETGLRPEDEKSITEQVERSSDYRVFLNCRTDCVKASGGVAILVAKDIDFDVSDKSMDTDWMLAGKLYVPGRSHPLGVIGSYIPNKSSKYFKQHMFDCLGSAFLELGETSSGVVALGDINRRLGSGQGCPDRSFLRNFPRATKDSGGRDGRFLNEFADKYGVYFLNGRVPGNIPAKMTNSRYESGVKKTSTEVDYVMGNYLGFRSAVYMDVGRVDKKISYHSELRVYLPV